MKLTSIQTSNFLGARSVDVKLVKPVTLFAGKNYAGKSSIQEAVRMALTGESVRVALKKDYAALITDDQESGYITVEWDGGDASVVLPSGKRNLNGDAPISGALPYVLDAQRFAHMDVNDRRAFLFGLMGLKTDGPAVKERLIARKCDAKNVELVAPMLRAGFDAAQKEAQTKARECKSQWKQIANGETYGAVKAASFKFQKPEVDAEKINQAKADLVKINAEIDAEVSRLGDLQVRARQAAEQSGRLADLREKAGRFARIQDKLNKDEAELKNWEQKVSDVRSSLKSQDALACPDCGVMLVLQDGKLVHAAPMAKGTEDDIANLPEYERALKLFENSVANGKRDLAAAEAAATALTEIEKATAGNVPTDEEVAALKARIDVLKHGRDNQQAGIRLLEDSKRLAEEADEKTARAAALHLDVQKWEAIGDALAPDGIPGDILAEALGPINDRLKASSNDAEWARATIDSDMAIYSSFKEGNQAQRPYTLLSESEKWRADAMIAEAISFLSGTKLLVIDRFDVLDIKGREDLLIWLDILAQDGEVETALIFGTLKSLPAQLPNTVAGFWIENGTVSDLKVAA